MKFRAVSGTTTLILESPTYFDAKSHAASILENPTVELTGEHAVADVELRWVGVDLNGGHRRLEIRKRGGKWRTA